MDVLFQTESKLNDVEAPEVVEKVNLCRNDPHSAKIKPEFILIEKKTETESSNTDEPKAKKQKKNEEKGSHKKQVSVIKQVDGQFRLCPFVAKCNQCIYGSTCKYSHDIHAWMLQKPKDISDKCYLFDLYGQCPFGVSCRFGSQSHIRLNPETNQYENLVNEEKRSAPPQVKKIYNVLDADLKNKLWKRKYDFGRSEKILKTIDEYISVNREIVATYKYNQNKGFLQKKAFVEKQENGTNDETAKEKKQGSVTDEDLIRLRPQEKKKIDWKNKLYLAPLTTVGNLPFRRICKELGADITCSEMAMSTNLLSGQASEWALLKRHESEDLFGIQLAGAYPDTMTKACQVINENMKVDFVDINSGCPIDLVFDKGAGCALMTRLDHLQKVIRGMDTVLDCPLTVKIRAGIKDECHFAHELISEMKNWGVSMITIHGRTRQQRYSKLADWEYVEKCAKLSDPVPVFGCGDILSYHDYNEHMKGQDGQPVALSGCMIARGALYKPWLFTEIKEQRDWDISAQERFDLMRRFVNYGLEHWGSDTQGVETTRRFLLEWLSFLYRYIPVGLLEQVPQKINLRPPYFFGRNELETLLASQNSSDWIKISEMLLGPVPTGFQFVPKHKANAY